MNSTMPRLNEFVFNVQIVDTITTKEIRSWLAQGPGHNVLVIKTPQSVTNDYLIRSFVLKPSFLHMHFKHRNQLDKAKYFRAGNLDGNPKLIAIPVLFFSGANRPHILESFAQEEKTCRLYRDDTPKSMKEEIDALFKNVVVPLEDDDVDDLANLLGDSETLKHRKITKHEQMRQIAGFSCRDLSQCIDQPNKRARSSKD